MGNSITKKKILNQKFHKASNCKFFDFLKMNEENNVKIKLRPRPFTGVLNLFFKKSQNFAKILLKHEKYYFSASDRKKN